MQIVFQVRIVEKNLGNKYLYNIEQYKIDFYNCYLDTIYIHDLKDF